jgi:cysteine-rich repeat protein
MNTLGHRRTPWDRTARPRRAVAALARALFCIVLLAPGRCARASDFHVAPHGTPSGDGSVAAPWDLATALAQPAAVAPGDTIWLHQGVYRGSFESRLAGTEVAAIVVRQAPGERAVLDGGCSGRPTLVIGGPYAWYRDFELVNADPHRTTKERGSFPRIPRGIAVYTREDPGASVGVKMIDLVIHDTAEGIGVWKEAVGAEVYGNLIYYNGWEAPDRGHGHGIYAQNRDGTMRIVDNVLFDQFSHGIHAYGSEQAYLNGLHVEGNVAFGNGSLSSGGSDRNVLVGGGRVAENPVIVDNVTYFPFGTTGENNFGYSAGATGLVATGNYFAGDLTLWMISDPTYVLTGNTFVGGVYRFALADYPDNTYLPPVSPGGTKVFVRPNAYEAGRANVAIFNWDALPSVPVDLSSVLAPGDAYEVRDAANFFGPPVAGGTYAGGTIAFPMNLTTVARPIGIVPVAPVHTAPEFAAFVVLPGSGTGPRCGDGVVDPGEQCDDGGILDGDGCSGTCGSESLCPSAPASGCKNSVAGGKSSLLVTRQGGTRDTFVWRATRGAATSMADLGDPSAGARYAVCVYDGGDALVQRFDIPAERDLECGDARWRRSPSALRFADDDQLPDGKLTASFKPGAQGRSTLVVSGRGSFLGNVPLPATSLPLRVQLQASTGACWDSTFASARQNTTLRLRASGS